MADEQMELLDESGAAAGGHRPGSNWTLAKAICKLVCCPPIPSRIAAKLAFVPPSPPSYNFVGDEGAMTMFINVPSRGMQPFTPRCAAHPVYIGRKQTIAAVHIELEDPRFTIIFSHGNAVDIGQMAPALAQLALDLNCSVLAYDYPGYGISKGKPLEAGLYSSIEAAWTYLRNRCGILAANIVLYGQSIGSAPSTHFAAKLGKKLSKRKAARNASYREDCALGGVVLHSPLSSGIRVVRPKTSFTCCFDPFANIEKIGRIQAPTLIIHGTEDEVVPISHGYELHGKLQNPVDPFFLESAGHNDIELFVAYKTRLKEFVNELSSTTLEY